MQSKTLNINIKNGVKYITFPKLEERTEIRHIFSSRIGGVSTGRYASMNLSFSNGDTKENVLKNYKILCGIAGIDIGNLVLSQQTHTNNVKIVSAEDKGAGIFEEPFQNVDGLITNTPGIALVTQYADCTPLLFFDPKKKVIASSHSGWRGTVKEIGKVTVHKMRDNFGSNPKDIIVGIGPCISKCCYEVDTPVFKEFKKIDYLDLNKIFTDKGNGKFMLDTAEANRQILINAGIDEKNMDISDLCTNCHSDELHSHRATKGERGNMAAIIELK